MALLKVKGVPRSSPVGSKLAQPFASKHLFHNPSPFRLDKIEQTGCQVGESPQHNALTETKGHYMETPNYPHCTASEESKTCFICYSGLASWTLGDHGQVIHIGADICNPCLNVILQGDKKCPICRADLETGEAAPPLVAQEGFTSQEGAFIANIENSDNLIPPGLTQEEMLALCMRPVRLRTQYRGSFNSYNLGPLGDIMNPLRESDYQLWEAMIGMFMGWGGASAFEEFRWHLGSDFLELHVIGGSINHIQDEYVRDAAKVFWALIREQELQRAQQRGARW
ncbi:RING finger protein [Streptomyces sp. NPDC091376]|uniref:RING finger protein n=1 Tax=Streptomyces sp. NPDC091376 TaxID=3365994 RepID=UPI00382562DA